MSTSAQTRPEIVPITGETGDGLRALGLPDSTVAAWSRFTAPSIRAAFVLREDQRPVAVAFTASRNLCASVKLVGTWCADESRLDSLLEPLFAAVERWAWDQGAVVVKHELEIGTRAVIPGYESVETPGSVAPELDGALPSARFRWRRGTPAGEPPYMRQSTDFTCGPAALLMGLAGLGLRGAPDRAAEVSLWRQATTVMGCDPYGLALAAADQGAQVEVRATTDSYLLLEDLEKPSDLELRRLIQAGFRAQVADRQIGAQVARFGAAEVRAALRDGKFVLVLIDEYLFIDEVCPHWILVHAEYDDVLLAHDPWPETAIGESWVDGFDVPLRDQDLERLANYGDPPYSAMITLSR